MTILVAALLLAGCSAPAKPPVVAGVDVDTPALRAQKKAAGIADCPVTDGKPVKGGLPDVTLPCLGGGPGVNPARLRGPVVVNFWAQSCTPCRHELPIYQKFSKEYAGKVAVLGIDWQDTLPGGALKLAQDTGVTYPQLADTEPAVRLRGLPQIVLIDKDGKIAYRAYEVIKSEQQLEALVHEHLDVS